MGAALGFGLVSDFAAGSTFCSFFTGVIGGSAASDFCGVLRVGVDCEVLSLLLLSAWVFVPSFFLIISLPEPLGFLVVCRVRVFETRRMGDAAIGTRVVAKPWQERVRSSMSYIWGEGGEARELVCLERNLCVSG